MEPQKVDMYVMSVSKYFEGYQLNIIREKLLSLDDTRWRYLMMVQFKDPVLILIISILVGTFGIDRFIIGDVGLGLGKLLTCGGLGFWYLVDLFLIMRATREKNMQQLQQILF